MYKPQCLGMQGLTGTDFETVVYKLFVFAEMSSFQDFMTAIAFVVEQRVPDIFHVYANLMGASGLKHTFHQRDVAQPFQHLIVSDGMFSLSRVGHDGHLHPVARLRPMLPTMVPSSCSTMPHTKALYSRLVVLW